MIQQTIKSATILNVDCMEYMATLQDKHFDLAVCDPPYGISINGSGRLGHYGGKGKNWDSVIPEEKYFRELYRVSKNQVIWGGNYFHLLPTRCFLIWDKKQPEGVSFASHEYAWTSFDKSAKCFYQRPQNMEEVRIHSTQKPTRLYEWILKNYAKPGQTIFDSHMGSGSSAIACNNMGFEFVGCELDTDYYEAACKRIAQNAQQERLFA